MPAPDYPRVPFPDHIEPGDGPWWYEPPIRREIFDGLDALHPRVAATHAHIDRWPVTKIAEALDKGLIDGWPWTLTERGKRVLGSPRRR